MPCSYFLFYYPSATLNSTTATQTRYYRTPRELPPLTLAFGVGRPALTRSRESSVGRFCGVTP